MANPSYSKRMQLLRRDYDRMVRLRLAHQKVKENGGYTLDRVEPKTRDVAVQSQQPTV